MRKKIVYLISFWITFCFTNPISYGGEDMFYQEGLTNLKMSYRLEGAYSPYKYVRIDILGTGEASLDYEVYREYVSPEQPKKETINFRVEKETIKELLRLYQEKGFFNIEVYDLNKERICVTDVGTTTLTLSYTGKERNLSYGYIENNPFQEILNIYWSLIKEHLRKI